MQNVKLLVVDKGDPSVGLFPCAYEVECPFYKGGIEKESLNFFREEIEKLYYEFSNGRVRAMYDFESDFEPED